MTRQNKYKLNHLLTHWPSGTVSVYSWLKSQGISRKLVEHYKRKNWVYPIGRGAVARKGDQVDWPGGLYAIQKQLGQPIHVGAKTALELKGYSHFVSLGKGGPLFLFGPPRQNLPGWFSKYKWDRKIHTVRTNLILSKDHYGFSESDQGSFSIKISSPERAIMEALFLVPSHQSFEEAYYLMEGLGGLRPSYIQTLLEACQSIKVKRLFMYMAEKCDHSWIKRLDLTKVYFGKGKRVIVKNGKFDPKYNITVANLEFEPREK